MATSVLHSATGGRFCSRWRFCRLGGCRQLRTGEAADESVESTPIPLRSCHPEKLEPDVVRIVSATGLVGWFVARDRRAVVAVSVFGAVLLWARAPSAVRNFYAEDGAIHYHEALTIGFGDSLGKSVDGYYVLVPRVVGFVVALVPVPAAALVNYLMVALVVAWINSTIYLSSETTLKSPLIRLSLAMSVTLLPIVGFESIANSANLQYLLLCASAVVLLGRQQTIGRRVNGVVILVITGLTTPLLVSLAPLVGMRIWRDRRDHGQHLPAVAFGWISGVVGQLSLVALFEYGSRGLGEGRSLQRTVFLFLDRVLGYNFIPFWPRITSESYSDSVNATLIGRALVCLLLVCLVAFLFVRVAQTGLRFEETNRVVSMILIVFTGGAFWLFIGTLFSTEPRYAVFPAFCITWSVLIAAELLGVTGTGHESRTRRQASAGIVFLLLLAFVTHWTPSELRRTGPTWSDGLRTAEEVCATTSSSMALVRIIPVYTDWWVELPCERIE